jgi:hypothetical protein
MRSNIIGVLMATLYTLAVAALMSWSMPTPSQLRASVEAFRPHSSSTGGIDARD